MGQASRHPCLGRIVIAVFYATLQCCRRHRIGPVHTVPLREDARGGTDGTNHHSGKPLRQPHGGRPAMVVGSAVVQGVGDVPA